MLGAPEPTRTDHLRESTLPGSPTSWRPELPPRQEWGPTGNPGLEIPESYGQDRVVLMVQDPDHLFTWWELSGPGLAEARRDLGSQGDGVLLLHGPGGVEQRQVELFAGNYYFTVAPESAYRIEVGLRGADGRVVVITASNEVQTPASDISDDLDLEWMAVDETFLELLRRAGLPGEDALSSAERFRVRQLLHRHWAEELITSPSSGELGRWSSLSVAAGLSSLELSSRLSSLALVTRVSSLEFLGQLSSMELFSRVSSLEFLSRISSMEFISRFSSMQLAVGVSSMELAVGLSSLGLTGVGKEQVVGLSSMEFAMGLKGLSSFALTSGFGLSSAALPLSGFGLSSLNLGSQSLGDSLGLSSLSLSSTSLSSMQRF